ncbi:MAG: hypothetical protein M3P85_04780 [Actinomycetota bacterium]|nr:hypothetical protein [Actinomycetota bacterium]
MIEFQVLPPGDHPGSRLLVAGRLSRGEPRTGIGVACSVAEFYLDRLVDGASARLGGVAA